MTKLVRDNIPEIIVWKWDFCDFYIAKDQEYSEKLFDKLKEETQEVVDSRSQEELKEELADVLEVIEAICDDNNINMNNIKDIKKQKKVNNWWFTKKIILKNY